MNKFGLIIFVLLVTISNNQAITGNLQITNYDPLHLKLTFSEIVQLPSFILLFDQISIDFTFLETQPSNTYYIESNFTNTLNPQNFMTQKYVLLFTQPLDAAYGRLALNSFSLTGQSSQRIPYPMQAISQKASLYKFQSHSNSINIIAIIICIFVYFLAYTTQIGLNTFIFISVYVYISLMSPLFTALDFRIAYFLLFDIHQVPQDSKYQNLYMFTPHILIVFSFIVSGVCRFIFKNMEIKSGFWNYMQYYFCYKFAIITWDIMCTPIFANTVHNIRQFYTPGYFMSNKYASSYVIYINVLLLLFYVYLAYLTSNPQIGETCKKWEQYTESDHYKLFQSFHQWTDPSNWLKRNHKVIFSLCRLTSLFFVSIFSSSLPNLILQVGFLMYLLSISPFTYTFFNVFSLGIRLIIVSLYIYRFIVDVYMSTHEQILTSCEIDKITLINVIILCSIIGIFLIMGIYQFYQKVRRFRMSIKDYQLKQRQVRIKSKKSITTIPDQMMQNQKTIQMNIQHKHQELESPPFKVLRKQSIPPQMLKNPQSTSKQYSLAIEKKRKNRRINKQKSLLLSLSQQCHQ